MCVFNHTVQNVNYLNFMSVVFDYQFGNVSLTFQQKNKKPNQKKLPVQSIFCKMNCMKLNLDDGVRPENEKIWKYNRIVFAHQKRI